MRQFNAPPGWPDPPTARWRPPKHWRPAESWPPAPDGWAFWVDENGDAVRGPLGRFGGTSMAKVGAIAAIPLALIALVLFNPFAGGESASTAPTRAATSEAGTTPAPGSTPTASQTEAPTTAPTTEPTHEPTRTPTETPTPHADTEPYADTDADATIGAGAHIDRAAADYRADRAPGHHHDRGLQELCRGARRR